MSVNRCRRYDSCFTEVPVSEIVHNKEQVKERLNALRGGLYIREYPAGQATVPSAGLGVPTF